MYRRYFLFVLRHPRLSFPCRLYSVGTGPSFLCSSEKFSDVSDEVQWFESSLDVDTLYFTYYIFWVNFCLRVLRLLLLYLGFYEWKRKVSFILIRLTNCLSLLGWKVRMYKNFLSTFAYLTTGVSEYLIPRYVVDYLRGDKRSYESTK